MSNHIFTVADLKPECKRLFEEVKAKLPPEIASRLTCSRSPRVHGNYRTVLLFNTWDRLQSDVLPKQHFCYCLGYDPKRLISGGSTWYFHLWLNTVRIYRDRIVVKSKLETDLKKVCPKPFVFTIGDRCIDAKIKFELAEGPAELVDYLLPHYVRLIRSIHPVLMPIIDRFSVYGRQDVKAEVARRGRIAVKPVRTAHPELMREYSRSIPPSWRAEILKRHGHKCALCDQALSGNEYHLDHIQPFSRGGTTTKENLQPLCPRCNLTKGSNWKGK